MSQGTYVVCDPQSGWSVKALDDFGMTLQVFTSGHPTMEAAIREYTVGLNKAVAFKLSPGQSY